MIIFQPVAIARRTALGQTPAVASATPAATPVATPAVVVQTPSQTSPLVNMIGWTVVGFASGAASAYVVGKGLGRKGSDMGDALLGGVGGAVGALLAKVL